MNHSEETLKKVVHSMHNIITMANIIELEWWDMMPCFKTKVGVSVLISFISTLNDQRVYKVDELLKDGTFRFTTIIDGIIL